MLTIDRGGKILTANFKAYQRIPLLTMRYTETATHILDIRSGDTILHYGVIKTVCKCNIKYSLGVGTTLFGDSYNLGYKAVVKITDLKY